TGEEAFMVGRRARRDIVEPCAKFLRKTRGGVHRGECFFCVLRNAVHGASPERGDIRHLDPCWQVWLDPSISRAHITLRVRRPDGRGGKPSRKVRTPWRQGAG